MNLGIKLIRIASVYMLVGLAAGIAMAVSKNFTLMSVHSHILLLGWATMALTGLVYLVLPRCTNTKLAGFHFWAHNTGLPLMMVSLTLSLLGNDAAEPVIGIGSILVLAALAAFTINVFSARFAGTDQNEMFTISSPPAAARTRT